MLTPRQTHARPKKKKKFKANSKLANRSKQLRSRRTLNLQQDNKKKRKKKGGDF